MKKWEYVTKYNCEQRDLTEMGVNGWELITVYKEYDENRFIIFLFKKEI